MIGLMSLPPIGPTLASRALLRWRDQFFASLSKHPERFRHYLRECAGLVSGSAILHAVGAVSESGSSAWAKSSTDLFLPVTSFRTFCDYLISREEGVVVERVDYTPGPSVYVSQRRIIRTSAAVLCVYCTTDSCPLVAVAASHLDIQLSFISADTLCLAYPWSVARMEASFRTTSPDTIQPIINESTRKYAARGYRIRTPMQSSSGPCRPYGTCPKSSRYFGDEHCLTIAFPEAGADGGSGPRSRTGLFQTALWTHGGPPCGNPTCLYSVQPTVESCTISSKCALY